MSGSCLLRSRPRARAAIISGPISPPTRASSIARPEVPTTSEATEASFTFAPLEHLLDPVHLGRALLEERRPITGRLAQLALTLRDERRPEEAVAILAEVLVAVAA